jgi:WD40 repeat protein
VVAFSTRGRSLAVGFHDGHVELWSASTGAVERSLPAHARHVNAVAFSPDDRLLASASRDGTAKVHRADGRVIARLEGHEGAVTSVAFTRDGGRVITGGSDQTACLWTLLGGRQTHRFDHGERVTALDVSPDGRRVAAGARGGEVRVWSLAGVEFGRFGEVGPADGGSDVPGRSADEGGRARDVAAVRFSDDGEAVLVVARSGAAALWSVEHGTVLERGGAELCGRVAKDTADHPVMVAGADETELRQVPGGEALAYYPVALREVRASPTGRAWAALAEGHVHLLVLEEG